MPVLSAEDRKTLNHPAEIRQVFEPFGVFLHVIVMKQGYSEVWEYIFITGSRFSCTILNDETPRRGVLLLGRILFFP